jgi:hypothetical protein
MSHNDVGQDVDTPEGEYEYYSSSEEAPPPKKEKKHKEPKEKHGKIHVATEEQQPPKPGGARLSQARRLQIIADQQNGVEDPEYLAVQNPNTKTWRVTKRKTLKSPSVKVEATAPSPAAPPGHDILVTWMNMQQSENEGLKSEMRKLGKKYEKLATKYELSKTNVPVIHTDPEEPAVTDPVPVTQTPPPENTVTRTRPGTYVRARKLDVRQF